MGLDLTVESFAYPDGPELFRSLELSLGEGQAVALVGRSGIGKSTLVSLLAGLHPEPLGGIWKGKYLLDSQEVSRWSPQERVTKLGYLGPNPKLFLTGFCSTVREEVGWSLFGLGWKIEDIEKRVKVTLQDLGISHLNDSVPGHLSGGQQQLVALATVWARQPNYLLLDNPVSSLDLEARKHLIDQIQKLKNHFGTTVVFATARVEDIAWCETVCHLNPKPDGPQATLIRLPWADWDPSESGCLLDEPETGACGNHEWSSPAQQTDNPSHKEVSFAIDIADLCYTPRGHPTPLFDQLCWRVGRGESVALLGANGSGKSTLGRILRGFQRTTSGSVFVSGQAVAALSVPQLTPYVAYTFQEPSNLFLQRTVNDELLYSGQLLGLGLERAQARREEALELFELKGVKGRHPRELSESDGALLGVALAWYTEAEVQILDEPSARLDARGRRILEAVLTDWREKGSTVILIDHDEKWLRRRANSHVVLKNGRLF